MSRGTLLDTNRCIPATELFQLIGDKWTMIVAMSLREGALRFSELRRNIPGVSQRTLTLTLRTLERDGLISRTVTPSVPPRVDYDLTALGREFCEKLQPVGMWAFANRPAIEAARAAFDARPDQPTVSSEASPAAQAAAHPAPAR